MFIYNIENKVLSDSSFDGVGLYGFVNEDSQFYFCSPTGMGSGDVFVMDLPGFNIKYLVDYFEEGINTCGPFDNENNILQYELYTVDEITREHVYQTYEYDLDDETVTEI